MKKLLLILSFIFILCLPAFAEWNTEYDFSKGNIYFTTININEGAAWLIINTTIEDVVIFLEFQNVYLGSDDNIKLEYQLGNNSSKFITGKKNRDKLIIFSSKRSNKNVTNFIEDLKNNEKLIISFNDGSRKIQTFIFDVSGLENTFEEFIENFVEEIRKNFFKDIK